MSLIEEFEPIAAGSPGDTGQRRYTAVVRAYRQHPHEPDADRALSACAAHCGDLLIVEFEKDEQISREAMLSMQAAFRQINSLSHRIIPGVSHAMCKSALNPDSGQSRRNRLIHFDKAHSGGVPVGADRNPTCRSHYF